MARRKSLFAEIYAQRQRAKAERQRAEERARKEYVARARQIAAQRDRELARERREQERLARAEERAREQAERIRQRNEAAAARRIAGLEREQQRQVAAAERERRQQAVEERRMVAQRRLAEAEFRTDAVARQVAALERLLTDRNRGLVAWSRRAEDSFNQHGSVAFVEVLQQALARSVYPDGLHGASAALYRPEARELLVEYELPRQQVVPEVAGFRYLKTRDLIQPEPRREAETKKLYARLIARVALRTLAEAFAAAPATLVDAIVFNGYVSAKDRATGQVVRPLLISTHATRPAFEEIVLDEPELDPVACLRGYLNAVVSPHPFDLEAVRPVVQFDLSKYKFVEEMDVVAGLDARMDLLQLKPVEFEHLIRQLFEAIGMKSWVTQASRDEGVDGVAVNEDPIVGGLCIIQAKRYSKVVGLEAVQALAGVMEDKHAAKGVLVTTSWVGKASRDFAARNGRIEIIEGRNLKAMLHEHLDLDVLIGLPKSPPGWDRDHSS
jgi:restriction system protein